MKPEKVESIQKQIGGKGTFQKYREVTTGKNKGLFYFIFNEFHNFTTTSFPGKVGFFLRRNGFCYLCAKVGKAVSIGRECTLRRPQYISIGADSVIGDKVSLDVKNNGEGIIIGKNVAIGHSTVFSCPGGKIVIGEGSFIGEYCRLGSLEGLMIGNNVKLGNFSYIVGAGHAFDSLEIPIIQQSVVCKGPNRIGDNVVIGERVTILDGIKIGEGAKIKDDSLVNRDVPAGAIFGGIPAENCG